MTVPVRLADFMDTKDHAVGMAGVSLFQAIDLLERLSLNPDGRQAIKDEFGEFTHAYARLWRLLKDVGP